MPTSDTRQPAPYDITTRMWRDEQPGDEPRLVVSITFAPRPSTERWRDLRLDSFEVRAGDQRWTPSESTVSPPDGDGGFEIKALGAATLPAGARATIFLTLLTSSGEQRLELAAEILRVG